MRLGAGTLRFIQGNTLNWTALTYSGSDALVVLSSTDKTARAQSDRLRPSSFERKDICSL